MDKFLTNFVLNPKTEALIKIALEEDLGSGDITSNALIAQIAVCQATITAKAEGIICGLPVAEEVFRQTAKLMGVKINFRALTNDGKLVEKGQVIVELSGNTRAVLAAERTALNFLQQLSGVATLTHKFVEHSKARILDTRKTVPGMRLLQKYAVKVGGGVNHRIGLYDAILIKDNHIKAAGGVSSAIKRAKSSVVGRKPKPLIVVEVQSLKELGLAMDELPDRILLDNLTLPAMKKAAQLCREAKIATEASGGVNLKTAGAISRTGVDFISVGALTHSAPALDLSLKII